MEIIKRNGDRVPFNVVKIANAISKANDQVTDKLTRAEIEEIADSIAEDVRAIDGLTVEMVQDKVERALAEKGKFELAKCYIIYRYKRGMVRSSNSTDESILSLIRTTNSELMDENSNKNALIASTQRDLIAGEVSKDITKRILLPEKIVKAHEDGILHFHDMDYFLQPIFNCFHGKTEFVTNMGIKKFSDFKSGEEVEVLDKDGNWRTATVRNYGKKKMVKVTMKCNNTVKEVVCTPDHRWILSDGSVTTNLKIGDRLLPLAESALDMPKTKRECEMFCLGFVLGDGADHITSNGNVHIAVRLCGEKQKYIDCFRTAGYSVGNVGGDFYVGKIMRVGKQNFLSSKSWCYLPREDRAMLFSGYYAADGAVETNRLSTVDERLIDFVLDNSCLAGYHVSSYKTIIHDTNFKQNASITNFWFRKHNPKNLLWTVTDIESYSNGREFEAWCVEEPVTHSFTLAGGVVTGNCCLINIGDMLDNGTVMNGKMIESPRSFHVACNVMTQIIACVASNQYGGQSVDVSHLGKYLRRSRDKIVKRLKEAMGEDCPADLLKKAVDASVKAELKAGVQTIQYQINTLMTTNGQSPFVTLFMHLKDNDPYIEENAMIIEEILNQRLEGIKNEKGVYVTPAFPKLVYVLDENNCLKGGKYDYLTHLAAKCSAKRMYPDYISAKKMRENYEGNVFSPMGCRSFLAPWKDENGNYKFEGRFNQGVVSINLPQIGILSNHDENEFWRLLDERLDLCFEALMCRHKALLNVTSDVSPIHWRHGALARLKQGEKITKLLYGGYSSISLGYIGLYEMTKAVKGVSHTDPVGKEFALRVMRYLKDTCARWRTKTNIGFALYGTPAESLCYRFAKIDAEKFGNIPDITDKGYYTNSYHVDVREEIDAFSKFKFESEFQALSPGGAISYVEIPNMQNNVKALESLIAFMYDNIQYAEFNTKSDYCMVCGYDGEIMINDNDEWECPNCHNKDHQKMTVVRRTCGYLGSNYWNRGKTKEIKARVLHL